MVLTGEAGLGKTRLVQECRKRFIAWVGAGSGRLPLWLEGRGASYASATPYGLYRQLVASWVGVAPDEPAARLQPALERGADQPDGEREPAPAAGADDGHRPIRRRSGRTSPEDLQRMTFTALRSVVTRFAVAGPTVLVLEDLHWADPTSLRLTLELAELAAGRPLLVLATSRPDSGRQEIAALADAPSARRIVLRPLPASAEQTLAASLIGQVPGALGGASGASPEVLAAVLASADGNPLFLEERLTSLLETRALVREDGTWLLRQPAGPQLPQVLERLVRSRVDRLSLAAQEAIRAAAVLGPEFTAALLAAMLGTRPAELAPVLDELVASDLVHREPPEQPGRYLPVPARADSGGHLPGAAAGRAPRACTRGPRRRWRPPRATGCPRSPPSSAGTTRPPRTPSGPCATSRWPATTRPTRSPTTRRSPRSTPPWR